MLGLFLIPAVLGVALLVNVFDDDDDGHEAQTEEPVSPPPIQVGDGEDPFFGSDDAEVIMARDAGGYVNGADGDDTITGSNADDALLGGSGDDVIIARDGNDVVSGDAGDDRVFLGDGDDDYSPDDTYDNLAGDDFVRGGAGDDLIADLIGSNRLFGDLGDDALIAFDSLGEAGNYTSPAEFGTADTLNGGFGDDLLAGDDGDVMTGGAGFDVFFVTDDEDRLVEEVRITDFDTEEDTLLVGLLFRGLAPEPIRLEFDETLNAVRATYEGRGIAFLEGLTADDIPNIETALVTLDVLDNLPLS